MQLTGDWITAPGVQRVLGLLAHCGYQAYLVGGCVRNAVINQPIADIDMATDALPARVSEIAADAGLKVVPTGIAHGTVTIVVRGVGYEVTTFRRDVKTDGRRAKVAFSTEITEDASRRDFTMNALYADASGRLIDPMDGLADLLAGRVRFVGDAGRRIREDYLRILRFFRFHAWYGNAAEGIDPEALAACAENAGGIEALSRERIGHEMRRLLAAPDPTASVAAMQSSGILGRVLPGADARALGPLIHNEPPLCDKWLRRLAVLGGAAQADRLRLSASEAKRLDCLKAGMESTVGAAELAYRNGAETAHDVILLRAAVLGTPMPPDIENEIARGMNARFPISAADLMPGLQGPKLGARLAELESRWIASGFELSREQLLA